MLFAISQDRALVRAHSVSDNQESVSVWGMVLGSLFQADLDDPGVGERGCVLREGG